MESAENFLSPHENSERNQYIPELNLLISVLVALIELYILKHIYSTHEVMMM